MQLAKPLVVQTGPKPVFGHVMMEPERLEEILIDDIGAGRYDGIDHVASQKVGEDALEPGADERPGQAKEDRAIGIAEHAVQDASGSGQLPRAIGQMPHIFHQRHHVVSLDVDMFDFPRQIILLVRHETSLDASKKEESACWGTHRDPRRRDRHAG